jgi:putative ABC transport system substrate-binding protein
MQAGARLLGVRLLVLNASSAGEIEAAFATLVREGAGALIVPGETFFTTQREHIIALAASHKVPAIYQYSEFGEAGGLMSYGPSNMDAYRQVGVYTGRILHGDRPENLPVQQSTKIELTINMKTAKARGVTFPLALLGRADEVIE